MKFDVNLSLLFEDVPLLERPALAASCGFGAVECWWPFETVNPHSNELRAFEAAIRAAGVQLVALNLYGGDFASGERGLVAIPASKERFRASVESGVELAGSLGCGLLNALYGNLDASVSRRESDALAVENLAFAAERAARIGARIVVEALNATDFPAYGLHGTGQVQALIDRVRSETGTSIRQQYDVYHARRAGEDILSAIAALAPTFGHVQIADVPGRGQPGTGSLPFDLVFLALEQAGYDHWVGLEYLHHGDPEAAFEWLSRPARLGQSSARAPLRYRRQSILDSGGID